MGVADLADYPWDAVAPYAARARSHPDECVDCGACEPVCPVEAIYYEDDVPEQWSAYTKANVDFFDELGSPGGASKIGKLDFDVEPAKSLPPQEHDE